MREQRTFLLVGGNSGIGKKIAENLLQDNNEVISITRKSEHIPDGVRHIQADVLSQHLTKAQLPDSLDGFVYCPGTINLKPFRTLKETDFRKDFELNVLGAVRILQQIQRPLKKSKQASVVLFSTVAVQQGMPFHTSVACAKGAIEGMVRSLAAEWAPHIRVNAIAPSLVDTPLADSLLSSEEKRKRADERHPLHRIGTTEDIAEAARFLLYDQSSWMSGQIIGIDGGLSSLRV